MWSVGADVSVKNMIKMPVLNPQMSNVKTAQDCMSAAQNAELVADIDQTIGKWCQQIKQVCSVARFQPKFYFSAERCNSTAKFSYYYNMYIICRLSFVRRVVIKRTVKLG